MHPIAVTLGKLDHPWPHISYSSALGDTMIGLSFVAHSMLVLEIIRKKKVVSVAYIEYVIPITWETSPTLVDTGRNGLCSVEPHEMTHVP